MNLFDRWLNRPARYEQRGEPGTGFDRIRKAMDSAFERMRRSAERDHGSAMPSRYFSFPTIDVAESDQAVRVRIDLPGVRPADVRVEIAGDELLISGIRRDEWQGEMHTIRHRERHPGSFSRSLRLPAAVESRSFSLRQENGVMLLNIPKRLPVASWRVPVS